MTAAFLLAVQLAFADPPPEPPAVIDLLAPVRLLRCPERRPDEVVVCGQRPGEEDRLFFRKDRWGRVRKPEPEPEPEPERERGGIRVPF